MEHKFSVEVLVAEWDDGVIYREEEPTTLSTHQTSDEAWEALDRITQNKSLADLGEAALRIMESEENWSLDTLEALATEAQFQGLASRDNGLFKVIADLSPPCGHSACRQNYIETGDRECVEKD